MNNKYKTRTFEIKEHQKDIVDAISSLPRRNLHYITGQQSNRYPNLSLNELKKFIRRGIRQYLAPTMVFQPSKKESDLIKFFCVFETTKDFFHSQHRNTDVGEEMFLGLHFHLFISPTPSNHLLLRDKKWVCFPYLVHSIFSELTSIRHKSMCISKYDYSKIEDLDENFILYHTKQFMFHSSREMILTNY